MKKLKLELDDLKVESFDTSGTAARNRGTVQANEYCCCCCCNPCRCSGDVNCGGTCDYSCNGTCAESCNGTCVGSCNMSCDGAHSCYENTCDYYECTQTNGYLGIRDLCMTP